MAALEAPGSSPVPVSTRLQDLVESTGSRHVVLFQPGSADVGIQIAAAWPLIERITIIEPRHAFMAADMSALERNARSREPRIQCIGRHSAIGSHRFEDVDLVWVDHPHNEEESIALAQMKQTIALAALWSPYAIATPITWVGALHAYTMYMEHLPPIACGQIAAIPVAMGRFSLLRHFDKRRILSA